MKQKEDNKTIDKIDVLMKDSHYHTTIHHVVLLMEEVGYLKVLDDIMKQYNNTLKDKKPS